MHAVKGTLYGISELNTAPNAYGLPDFYEIHLWLWKTNPRGLFADWNPRVSCRGLPF